MSPIGVDVLASPERGD